MRFPIRTFLSYYKPYRRMFLAVLACSCVVSAIAIAFPLLVRYMTKDVLRGDWNGALPEVYRIGGLMLLLAVIQNAANCFVDAKGHEVGARIESDMRSELFAHMQTLSFGFYDKAKTGRLMSRITNDLLLIAELCHHGPEDYIKYAIRFVGAFAVLFSVNAPLAVVVFCFLPPLGAFAVYFNNVLNGALRRNKERIGDVNAQAEDSLAGIRTVQSFVNERIEIGKFNDANRRFLDSRNKTYRAEAYFFNGTELIVQLITIAVVVFGGVGIVDRTLDLADLITFLLYVGFLIEPIQRLTHMSTQFQEGIAGFQRFMEIMRLRPEIGSKPDAVVKPAIKGEIEFRRVTFRYADRSDHVLSGLSLRIRPGEYVALVGPSGAGKTTLCSLIPRFYDATEGEVLIDGTDVRDIELRSLRRSIGIVSQDIYLFAGTVLDNIRYGDPGASDEAVIAAAKRAGAHDFIMRLPDAYRSEVGERGVKLSGGQKQRLAIARVFLKDPPVLILDEATSALDNESERIVKQSLEALAEGRTTIVIAHRLSTIRKAQRIVVLTTGGIVEEGTHDSLLAQGGVYAHLYDIVGPNL